MANRILRDWTASESIDRLSEGAERFFTRLIMKADDFGCFYGNPKLLLSALFPLRNYSLAKVIGWRNECWDAGVIEVYNVEGKDYVRIKEFGQRLRIMNSKFPQPSDGDPLTNVGEVRTPDSTKPPETKRSRKEVERKSITPEIFDTKADAHKFLTTNHQDLSAAITVLSNQGWSSVNDVDVGALAFHFCEKNLDVTIKPKAEVRQHFQNWLNKIPIGDLQKTAIQTLARHERKQSTQVP